MYFQEKEHHNTRAKRLLIPAVEHGWLEKIAISAPKKLQEDINRNFDKSAVTKSRCGQERRARDNISATLEISSNPGEKEDNLLNVKYPIGLTSCSAAVLAKKLAFIITINPQVGWDPLKMYTMIRRKPTKKIKNIKAIGTLTDVQL
ncbi:hypothetical protein TNCV_4913411 [Trichonephila clavipes]|nr:hypothetical protein TNCV_4913411 [Trichonephila clavipes]